jgi:hypothetical protein
MGVNCFKILPVHLSELLMLESLSYVGLRNKCGISPILDTVGK